MPSCAPPPSRVSSHSVGLPVVRSLFSRNYSVSKSFAAGVKSALYRHLRSSRRWTSRRNALPTSQDFRKLGGLLDSVSGIRKLLNDRRYADVLAQELCSVFHVQDRTELQDFLTSVILSECVYKKVETTGDNVASTIAEFARQFPPGFVDIEAVQCSLQDVTHNYILASSKSAIYVAFMGTKQPRDLGADVDFLPEVVWDEAADFIYGQGPPAAHRGFLARAKSVDISYIHGLAAAQGKRLVLCGHSLGGAVAKLCTIQLLKHLPDWPPLNLQCFCFAAPAVGNASLADLVEQKGWSDYIHSYLMPEDSVIRLVSLAQQNGLPFNALEQRPCSPSSPSSAAGSSLESEPSFSSELSECPSVSSSLSEDQAASELAAISLDEGEAFDAAATAALPAAAPELPVVEGYDAVDARDVILDLTEEATLFGTIPGGPAAAAADAEERRLIRQLERDPGTAVALRSGSKRRWALKQLKRVARRAKGSWVSAASRMMSRYTPFGNHYFLLPTRKVISWEALLQGPAPHGALLDPDSTDTDTKERAGPFAFHRMMSYRNRILQIIERVGGTHLPRLTASSSRAYPNVKLVTSIFPAAKISSAVAWLPLLPAPSRPRAPRPTPSATATPTPASATASASLSSYDDEPTPASTPTPADPAAAAYQSDPATRAAAVAAAAAQPRGLGVAVPLPPKKPSKTVPMMIKVDGTALKQCRTITLRIDGIPSSLPVEVTHVLTNPPSTPPTPSPTAPDGTTTTLATAAAAPTGLGPLQHLLRPALPPWMLVLAPWSVAAGKLLSTVFTAATHTARRRITGPARPKPPADPPTHTILRVHLPKSIVRRLQSSAATPTPTPSPASATAPAPPTRPPVIELVAKSDFHETTIPIEMRPNRVAVLGTTAAASLFIHAALSGQLDLPVGPGNPGMLPFWLRKLPSVNLLAWRRPRPAPAPTPTPAPAPAAAPPPAPSPAPSLAATAAAAALTAMPPAATTPEPPKPAPAPSATPAPSLPLVPAPAFAATTPTAPTPAPSPTDPAPALAPASPQQLANSAVAALAAALATAASVSTGTLLATDVPFDAFGGAASAPRNGLVSAPSRLSSFATPTTQRKRNFDTSLESLEPSAPATPSLEPEPVLPRSRTAGAAGPAGLSPAGTAAAAAAASGAVQGRKAWSLQLPTELLATIWAAPSRLARAASGGFGGMVRGDGAGSSSEADDAVVMAAEAAARPSKAQQRIFPEQVLTAPELVDSAQPPAGYDAISPDEVADRCSRLQLESQLQLQGGTTSSRASLDGGAGGGASTPRQGAAGAASAAAVNRRVAAVKLALSASREAASEAGRRHAAASAWRTPRAGLSQVMSNPDLLALAEQAQAADEAPKAAPGKARRWSWFAPRTSAAAPKDAAAAAPAPVQQAAAVAEPSAAEAAGLEGDKLHAGVLYKHVAGSDLAAVQQLTEGFQRQEARVSWWTALWVALRANTAVASWPSTIGIMALVGRALMALPSAPTQFFNLIAENASTDHTHALLVVHQAGSDDQLLKTEEFSRLVGLARAADVAITPVVMASPDSNPTEVIMAQYAVCHACGLPLGCERVVVVESGVAADLSTLRGLPASKRKALGTQLQELWHVINQELLAKQSQLVNILPAGTQQQQQQQAARV